MPRRNIQQLSDRPLSADGIRQAIGEDLTRQGAIAHAAVYNLGTLWASDVTQGTDLEFGGMPWGSGADLARIDAHDPARHSAGYATPMLVIHGDLDYRVPVSHGLELYGVLKAKGVEARLVHYPDENHWILKPQNSLHWYGEFTGWLRRWLG